MSTSQSTIDYILDMLSGVPDILVRKMFGEYAVYSGKKVVALVCDDSLFVKITEEGKAFVGKKYKESPAYKGAKPSMLIDEDSVEDREWLSKLVRITADALPEPKPKKPKLKKPKNKKA